jgi:MFS family permease
VSTHTRNRNAVLFVAISLLAGFGSTTMSLVTGIWLLDLTGDSSLAALTGLCVFGPQLAGPWLGALLDRWPRRAVVVTVNLLLAAVLLSLLAVRTEDQAWLLFVVSLAYGVSYVLIDAGETALLPSALSTGELADVNGWRTSAQEGTKLVAPLVGAGLYAGYGGHVVAVVSAAMPVLVAVLYAALRLTGAPARPAKEKRAGLAVLTAHPVMARTVGLAALAIAMSGFTTAPMYALLIGDLGRPTTFLGVLVTAQGAGSVAAGLVAGRLISRYGALTVGVAGTIGYAVSSLARCVPCWPVWLGASVLAGIGLPWALVAAVTAVQTHTPAGLLGRVAATANTAMFAPIALAVPLGAGAVHLGARPALIGSAALCVAAALTARVTGQRVIASRS